MFVRVRDPQTRHEFDVDERSHLLTAGLVERIKPVTYPPAARPRRAKHHVDLSGTSAGDKPKSSGKGVATSKETHHG